MENENMQRTLVTLKSALKKVTLGAVLIGGLLIPTAQAADISDARQSLEQRVQVISEALHKKMSETSSDSDQAETASASEDLTAQWGNWGNWANWANWSNWNNWKNWYNWGNWGNWGNF